jgi:hypothetical protein
LRRPDDRLLLPKNQAAAAQKPSPRCPKTKPLLPKNNAAAFGVTQRGG